MSVTIDAGWVADPPDSEQIADLPGDVQQTREGVVERLAHELGMYSNSGGDGTAANDGYLLTGAGKAYYQTAAPTARPNGVALSTADKGRLWVDSDGTVGARLYVYTGSAWTLV